MTDSQSHFDVIIVGARVAGSAAAIMLGRQKRSVLLLDKASFPSDTLSTHIVLGGGARLLERLGVMEELERLGGCRLNRSHTRAAGIEFIGRLEGPKDTAGLCLSRFKTDDAMLQFARALDTVTIRDRFRVTDLIVEGGAVRGVRGQDDSGEHEFRAPLTIGADGIRSTVARLAGERIGAFARVDVPCARAYYYGYFSDVPGGRLEGTVLIEFGPRDLGYVAAPCDDGRIVLGTAFDAAAMGSFRTDLRANFLGLVAENPAVAAMLEGATPPSRIYSSGLLLNTYRAPVCDGAILLGDSGLHADPLFGQGHALALISAEIMGELAPRWFAAANGAVVSAAAMADFTARRDAALKPHYDATVATSRGLALDPTMRRAWRAASAEQWAADEVTRFANMLAEPERFPSFRFARLMARASG